MDWVVNDPARLLREKSALVELAREGWLTQTWRLERNLFVVDLDMTVHDRVWEATMTYPAQFPNALPIICPRDPTARWSGHQYGAGGPLCLELRPDNWRREFTGADLVRSAQRLLSAEKHPKERQRVLSAHSVSPGQALRSSDSRLVFTAEARAQVVALPQKSVTPCALLRIAHARADVRFITQLTLAETIHDIADLPLGIVRYQALFQWPSTGWIFKDESWTGVDQLTSVDALIEVLDSAGADASPLREKSANSEATIVLASDDFDSFVAFSIAANEPNTLTFLGVVDSTDNARRAPEEAQRLTLLRVGIVGLGSIGSKIAVSLARSGITKFVLADDDLFLGANVVRHELNWASVGAHKVAAIKETLSLIAPNIEVVAREHQVGGQESAQRSAMVLQDLAACDLIVDATADANTFLLLAGIAQENRRPLVWAQVFSGACGGLIARARPELDPNPIAMRDGIHAFFNQQSPAPFSTATGYDDTGETPHIAYDADVGFIATAATRLILDTALQRAPSYFSQSAYLLGMHREWIFQEAFDIRAIPVTGAGWDTAGAEADPDVVRTAFDAITEMIQQAPDGPRPAH